MKRRTFLGTIIKGTLGGGVIGGVAAAGSEDQPQPGRPVANKLEKIANGAVAGAGLGFGISVLLGMRRRPGPPVRNPEDLTEEQEFFRRRAQWERDQDRYRDR